MRLKTIEQTIKHRLCLGCGLCAIGDDVKMEYSGGCYIPNKDPQDKDIEASCPAKGYDLKRVGEALFGNVNHHHELGYYRDITICHTTDNFLMKNAASGGVMGQIACSLLEKHLVDGIITNRFVYSGNIVRTETYIAQTKEDVILGQGSKYCPTSTLSVLKLLDPNKKYLLIGTPCQIAGFRLYSQRNKQVKQQIPYPIANFCGGYRDFRELDFFVSKIDNLHSVVFFRHRGGGQPGSMKIEGEKGELFQYPYPEYAKLSPFVKNERCTLCMDATGELADFSCGDAWLEHKDQTHPWSIVISRSYFASEFLKELIKEGIIEKGDPIDYNQVVESQKSNITSKKYRQFKRIVVRNKLLLPSPNWYDYYPVKKGSYLSELKIILSKQITKWKNKFK